MVAGCGPRKRSRCSRTVTVLVLEVLVRALGVAWEPGPRAGVWACATAEASPAAVLPGCGGEVTPGLEAAWGPMAGMAGVVPCEEAEAGPAGVLPGFGGEVDSRLEAVWGPVTGRARQSGRRGRRSTIARQMAQQETQDVAVAVVGVSAVMYASMVNGLFRLCSRPEARGTT